MSLRLSKETLQLVKEKKLTRTAIRHAVSIVKEQAEETGFYSVTIRAVDIDTGRRVKGGNRLLIVEIDEKGVKVYTPREARRMFSN